MLAYDYERNINEFSNKEVSEIIVSLQRDENDFSAHAADGSFEKIGYCTKVSSSRATPSETEL